MDAAELTRIREDIEIQLLPDTCDILSVTRTNNGFGWVNNNWLASETGIACRMDAKTGKEVLSAGAVQTYQGFMLSMPYDTQISTANRVGIDGYTYNVIAVNAGSWLGVKRVTLEWTGVVYTPVTGAYNLDFSQSSNSLYIAAI